MQFARESKCSSEYTDLVLSPMSTLYFVLVYSGIVFRVVDLQESL